MNYYEKLKDPRWQKKRLEIFERDEFQCQSCNSEDQTLHVHHKTYVYGNDPWDYPDINLITLCADCHQTEEYAKKEFQVNICRLLQDGYSYVQLSTLLCNLIYPVDLSKEDRIRFASFCIGDLYMLDHAKDRIEENWNKFFKELVIK